MYVVDGVASDEVRNQLKDASLVASKEASHTIDRIS